MGSWVEEDQQSVVANTLGKLLLHNIYSLSIKQKAIKSKYVKVSSI